MGCVNAKATRSNLVVSSKALPNKLPDKFSFMYPNRANTNEIYLDDIPFSGRDEIL
tara:strand:- start:193 stop:360 length:168 start_codon:yes stop_codon:yes gene_type:complete